MATVSVLRDVKPTEQSVLSRMPRRIMGRQPYGRKVLCVCVHQDLQSEVLRVHLLCPAQSSTKLVVVSSVLYP
jgi:hypothetical protein